MARQIQIQHHLHSQSVETTFLS